MSVSFCVSVPVGERVAAKMLSPARTIDTIAFHPAIESFTIGSRYAASPQEGGCIGLLSCSRMVSGLRLSGSAVQVSGAGRIFHSTSE